MVAMETPYIDLVLSYETMTLAGTARHSPSPDHAPRNGFEVKVVCDSTGRVVVSGVAAVVLATGRWTGEVIVERVVASQGPNTHQWTAIEAALREQLATAIATGVEYDRTARAVGEIVGPSTGSSRSITKTIASWVVGLVVLAALIGGYFVYQRYVDPHIPSKDLANGEECTRDKDCASRNCTRSTCRARFTNLANGERCEHDAECSSKDCHGRVCVSR